VTRRERALQQLLDVDRRKDVFLATLAHELRNPLAPIANGLQMIRLAAGDDPRIRQTYEMMDRQVNHLVHLVDDLLDVSRVSTGKIQLRHQLVPLRDVVARAVECTTSLFAQRAQALTVSLGESDCRVEGDAERLTQVFANLLGNASKFTAREGHVSIRVTCDETTARIDVVDDGVGIPRESLGRIFELFEQVPTPGGSMGGLGIGLALVSQLTQLHGGRVEAFSDGPGHGSRFTVTLPLAPDDRQSAPVPAARARGGCSSPTTTRTRRIRSPRCSSCRATRSPSCVTARRPSRPSRDRIRRSC